MSNQEGIKSLLAQNVREIRLVDGSFALALQCTGGYSQPLTIEGEPVFDEETKKLVRYNIRLVPSFMFPGMSDDIPDLAVKDVHVVCSVVPKQQFIDAYFETIEKLASYANPNQDGESHE